MAYLLLAPGKEFDDTCVSQPASDGLPLTKS